VLAALAASSAARRDALTPDAKERLNVRRSDWIAIGSAAVSFASLLGFVVVAILEHRSRRRLTKLEEDAQHDRLAPTIEMNLRYYEDRPGLEFVNQGPLDYSDIRVELDLSTPPGSPIPGFLFGDGEAIEGSIGPLRLGQTAFLPVSRPPTHDLLRPPVMIRVRASCTAQDGRRWTIAAECHP
jgi:hypothetical protein